MFASQLAGYRIWRRRILRPKSVLESGDEGDDGFWPDLSVLEEWSREEKEARSGGIRAKKISEPVFIGGRLRSRNAEWKREEDAPYRFTYFNEEFQSTIHSQTISELLQPGQTFRDLFIPDPPELEPDSSEDENDQDELSQESPPPKRRGGSESNDRSQHVVSDVDGDAHNQSGDRPLESGPQTHSKEKRYGPQPTFWLDVLCPTDAEMRVISKAFGIHALTAEDIMTQEAREKVELFRNYYFINYRTFEQDSNSENFLQPVNMYVIVFREGLLSFHFSPSPHPANVRRRIRLLKDYLILSADWISYAIIDDITDVFGPLIHSIENEVDAIDDTILQLYSDEKDMASKHAKAGAGGSYDGGAVPDATPSGSDMLRRVGDCRKKVMGLYRLLGNKADVIKGLAKRCNEQWEVAPKSEIGFYLGDIQDHILTMTSNLSHYETYVLFRHLFFVEKRYTVFSY
jgi:magnesium transporter